MLRSLPNKGKCDCDRDCDQSRLGPTGPSRSRGPVALPFLSFNGIKRWDCNRDRDQIQSQSRSGRTSLSSISPGLSNRDCDQSRSRSRSHFPLFGRDRIKRENHYSGYTHCCVRSGVAFRVVASVPCVVVAPSLAQCVAFMVFAMWVCRRFVDWCCPCARVHIV